MKEILEAFRTRISSPLFGYLIIAFFAINWKAIFYLLAGEVPTLERIEYFESNTTINTLLTFPLIFAVLGTSIYPWINYLFLYICKKPTELRNRIQVQSEHSLLLEKQNLEQVRTSSLADREKELIERAIRDKELENIEESDEKKKIKSEIERLRRERDEIRLDIYTNTGNTIINDRDKFLNVYRQLEIVRNLVKDDPDKYQVRYASLLNDYANRLAKDGNKEEANKYYSEEREVRKLIEEKIRDQD
jgi:hypothetical protein